MSKSTLPLPTDPTIMTKYAQIKRISVCFTNKDLHRLASDTIDETIFLPQDKNASFPDDLIMLLSNAVEELLLDACP
jgi:hypothetical protein